MGPNGAKWGEGPLLMRQKEIYINYAPDFTDVGNHISNTHERRVKGIRQLNIHLNTDA